LIIALPFLGLDGPDLHALKQALLFFGDHRSFGRFHAGEGRDCGGDCSVQLLIPLSLWEFLRS